MRYTLLYIFCLCPPFNELWHALTNITLFSTHSHVLYGPSISPFSTQFGALGFTVLPLIDTEIAPPQMFHSALGITSSPNVTTVMKHLNNLTAKGAHFPPGSTLLDIFYCLLSGYTNFPLARRSKSLDLYNSHHLQANRHLWIDGIWWATVSTRPLGSSSDTSLTIGMDSPPKSRLHCRHSIWSQLAIC